MTTTAPVVKQTRELVASLDSEADWVVHAGRVRRVVKVSRTGVRGRMLVTFDNPIESATAGATDEWEIHV